MCLAAATFARARAAGQRVAAWHPGLPRHGNVPELCKRSVLLCTAWGGWEAEHAQRIRLAFPAGVCHLVRDDYTVDLVLISQP
jgi:hypothetical protein